MRGDYIYVSAQFGRQTSQVRTAHRALDGGRCFLLLLAGVHVGRIANYLISTLEQCNQPVVIAIDIFKLKSLDCAIVKSIVVAALRFHCVAWSVAESTQRAVMQYQIKWLAVYCPTGLGVGHSSRTLAHSHARTHANAHSICTPAGEHTPNKFHAV